MGLGGCIVPLSASKHNYLAIDKHNYLAIGKHNYLAIDHNYRNCEDTLNSKCI